MVCTIALKPILGGSDSGRVVDGGEIYFLAVECNELDRKYAPSGMLLALQHFLLGVVFKV